jgi:hypothetical protein
VIPGTRLPAADNGVIGIAAGIGVTGLATFDNPVNWTTTSSSVWSDPWPFPPDDRQPTRAQTELLSVLGDLVLEYAQTNGPSTALLRAVRDAYQAGFHPGAPR